MELIDALGKMISLASVATSVEHTLATCPQFSAYTVQITGILCLAKEFLTPILR